MSAHGPREEFVERAWQELALELELDGKYCGWFKSWFSGKLVAAGWVRNEEPPR